MVTHKKQKRYLDWLTLQKELEYGDGNTQTRQAIIRSTLKKDFVMEVCNTQTQHNIWISFKKRFDMGICNTHPTKQYLDKH
mgnify:CR=1 FL=1